jgi:hypothetical protein
MITNIEEFSNFNSKTSYNNNVIGKFSVYKIINKPYERIHIREKNITMNNIKEIFDLVLDIKIDYEYSIFSLNAELTYDNKIKGGRILINLLNNFNTSNNTNINLSSKLFPIENKNITMMHRFYFVLSTMVLLKNYNKDNFVANDLYMKFIYSLEGVILQKNIKNIKIVLSIDEDFTIEELNSISIFIKKILYLDDSISFRFNYHNDINKNHIIK